MERSWYYGLAWVLLCGSCVHNTDATSSTSTEDERPLHVEEPQSAAPEPSAESGVSTCPPSFATHIVGEPMYGANAGFGQEHVPEIVLGPPHGEGAWSGSLDVLSVGLGGEIILGFATSFENGADADFIVFENAFFISGSQTNPYAEPAEVSVSEDGENWTAFPCASEYPYEGCAGSQPVYSSPDNGISATDVAVSGGDIFDLATIGVEHAHYIRIRDLSDSGSGPGAGFDLDAIALLHPTCVDD